MLAVLPTRVVCAGGVLLKVEQQPHASELPDFHKITALGFL